MSGRTRASVLALILALGVPVHAGANERPSEDLAAVVALREAISAGNDDGVARAVTLAETALGRERLLYRWLAASRAEGEASRTQFAELAGVSSPLAAWARLRYARLVVEVDPALAAREADMLAADSAFAGAGEARRVAVLARLAADPRAAREAVESYVTAHSGDLEVREAQARALEGLGEHEAAVAAWRELVTRAPTSRFGRSAVRSLEALGLAVEVDLPPESLERRQQHEAAAEAYRQRAATAAPGSAERCQALFDVGRVLARGRSHGSAVDALTGALGECPGPALTDDARVWAHYTLARSATSGGRPEVALEHHGWVVENAAAHRLADDAAIHAARIQAARGDHAASEAWLRRAVALAGDMRGEARFLLGWSQRGRGALDDALATFDASLTEGPAEEVEGVRGRALYWRARTLLDLGRVEDGLLALEETVEQVPLTFYGRMAASRLRVVAPARAGREPSLEPIPACQIELDSPALERAGWLLAVGEREWALRELDAAGLGSDPRLLAALFARFGYPHEATETARRQLGPAHVLDDRSILRAAYPAGYQQLFRVVAEESETDAAFLMALAREESSFNPEAVSVSHAYGLMQIIRPTAQRLARPLGLPSDPSALTRPAINARIGARYVASLGRRYSGVVALVPAAYNAGEGSVDRWLRERPTQALDEWVESIPYAETRGYTRRVLQSYAVYAFLERGELVEFPLELPRR